MNNNMELEDFQRVSKQALITAKNEEVFLVSLDRIVRDLGFSNFDIMKLDNRLFITGALTTMTELLLDTYYAEAMYRDDLAIDCLSLSSEPIFYSDLCQYMLGNTIRARLFDRALLPFELMRNFSIYDIFCFPIQRQNSKCLIFSVMSEGISSGEFKRQLNDCYPKIIALANIVGNVIIDSNFCVKKNTNGPKFLTQRQKQVMILIAKYSLSNEEIASKLGIGTRTVEKHRADSKRMLNKSTLMGVLYEAVSSGDISIDDP